MAGINAINDQLTELGFFAVLITASEIWGHEIWGQSKIYLTCECIR